MWHMKLGFIRYRAWRARCVAAAAAAPAHLPADPRFIWLGSFQAIFHLLHVCMVLQWTVAQLVELELQKDPRFTQVWPAGRAVYSAACDTYPELCTPNLFDLV